MNFTINVAMTRTKKDLYIISNDIFKKISDVYKKCQIPKSDTKR